MSFTTYRKGAAQRQGLLDLCAALPICGRAIEVGSYAGESAEIFLTSGKVSFITCVDPFVEKHKPGVVPDYEREFDRRMAAFHGRVEKIKATSYDALTHGLIRRQTCDFLYIDAAHDYASVSWDIRYWQTLLRPGGYIGGHDYTDAQPGVVRAVNEEFGTPWRTFQDGSWLCRIGS